MDFLLSANFIQLNLLVWVCVGCVGLVGWVVVGEWAFPETKESNAVTITCAALICGKLSQASHLNSLTLG